MNRKSENFQISLLTTGGTIEKSYDESNGALENRGSFIEEILQTHLRLPYSDVTVFPLMSKDSLLMVDKDREMIASSIQKLLPKSDAIIVLHGTDTMVLSAQYCKQAIQRLSIPILFTGAMKPIGFIDSDAMQNITEALYACKLVAPGIYLSFHNKLFPADNVQKNKKKMTFEAITLAG